MCIEHVRISSFGTQEEFENLIRMLTVSQPSPKIDAPRGRPSSRLIAANLERTFDGRRQVWRPTDVDVVSWEETIEMRDMSMMNFRRVHIPIFEPLLQLPRAADLHWRE